MQKFTDAYDPLTTLEVSRDGSLITSFLHEGDHRSLLFQPEDRKAVAEAIAGHETPVPKITYSDSRFGKNMSATVELHGGAYLSASPLSDTARFREQGQAYLTLARIIPELRARYTEQQDAEKKAREDAEKRAASIVLRTTAAALEGLRLYNERYGFNYTTWDNTNSGQGTFDENVRWWASRGAESLTAKAKKRADDAALRQRRNAVLFELGARMGITDYALASDPMRKAVDRIIELEKAVTDA